MGVVELAQPYGQIPELEEEVNIDDNNLVYCVRDVLIAAKSGDSYHYNKLLRCMFHSELPGPEKAALLSTGLKALSASVSYIDDTCHQTLLNSVFKISMWNCGPVVMDSLIALIKSLATSSGKYVDTCLAILVRNFAPPMHMIDMLKQVRGQVKKGQVLSRVHKALEDIVELVPMTALTLQSIIAHTMLMTFRKHNEKDRLEYHVEYMKNMLRLDSGAIGEFVGRSMLMAVMDVLIDLDVAIGSGDIQRVDSSKGVFVMELEDEDETAGDDENDYDGELSRTLSQKSLGKNVTANLLDHLMVHIFEYLESCANEHRLSEVFQTLLDSFKMTMLNTYKSRFAQFVMFYACALDPVNCGVEFANRLADIFFMGDNHVTRMNAVAYLASYLARGKFLSAALVTSILKRLVDWCVEYCMTRGGMNPEAAGVFYSCCQAIMYVLCFHMRSIMDIHLLKSQLLLMPFEAIFKHKLEPLKVCLPSIVEEFLKQANAARLFPLSENETFIVEDMLESDLSRDFHKLEMFFPFDPCLLKTCDRNFIGPNFLYWKYVRTAYSISEEDSSDEEMAEDFEILNGGNFMGDGTARSFDQHDLDLDLDELNYGMNIRTIAPKNGLQVRFGGGQMQMPAKIRPSISPEHSYRSP